jgi:transposase InsO family protein
MARHSHATMIEQRVGIGEQSDCGQTDLEIAAATGLSGWTIRKWRRRWQRAGRSGLASHVGRPVTGALGHFPAEVRETLREMRQTHPGWGPQTLILEMEADERFHGRHLVPSRSRAAAFLHQEGMTRKYERHSELPQPTVEAPQQAHEEWEMDAQGVMLVRPAGKVSLINICDVFSTLKVDSYPCLHISKPSTLDYQLVLRRAFLRYGLPKRFGLDHDSVYYDNASASPFPTSFHLWLVALGIEVTFGQKGRPTDQPVVERSHQTMTAQALLGQSLANQPAIQAALDNRLDFLANRFPSRSLGYQPPLVAHPEAIHSGRPYHPEWEPDLLDMQRVYHYLAQGRWFRQVSAQGQFSLGCYRYGLGVTFANQMVEITFDPQTQKFICQSEDTRQTARLPARGLTPQDLMGELEPLVALPAYQLALPFSINDWRHMQLAALTGTT